MICVNNIVFSLDGNTVSAMTSASFAPFLQYVNVPSVSGELTSESVAMYSSGTIVQLGGESVVHTKIKCKSEDDFKEVYMSLEDYYDAPTSVLQSFWKSFSKKSVIVERMLDRITMPSTMVSKSSKLTQKGILYLETMPQFEPDGMVAGVSAWAIKQPTPSPQAIALKESVKIKESVNPPAPIQAPIPDPEVGDFPYDSSSDSDSEFESESVSESETSVKKRKRSITLADVERDIERGNFYLKRAEERIAMLRAE